MKFGRAAKNAPVLSATSSFWEKRACISILTEVRRGSLLRPELNLSLVTLRSLLALFVHFCAFPEPALQVRPAAHPAASKFRRIENVLFLEDEERKM